MDGNKLPSGMRNVEQNVEFKAMNLRRITVFTKHFLFLWRKITDDEARIIYEYDNVNQ